MTLMTQDVSASSLPVQHSDDFVPLTQGKGDGRNAGKGAL